jgi:hypothetical protein
MRSFLVRLLSTFNFNLKTLQEYRARIVALETPPLLARTLSLEAIISQGVERPQQIREHEMEASKH